MPSDASTCGTNAGHAAHRRRKETPCGSCVEANREYMRSRRHLYRGRYAEYNLNYSKENPEKNRDRVRKWREANPDKYKAAVVTYHNRRRARKASVLSEPYTDTLVLETYGTLCHICHEEVDLTAPRTCGVDGWELGLHIDHVVPLFMGGSDMLANVKPAHAKCNLAKPRKRFTSTT